MNPAGFLQKRRRERRLTGDAVAIWDFEDSLVDGSGNGHDLSLSGNPAIDVVGKNGDYAASLSENNYLTANDHADLRGGGRPFCWAGWVKQVTVTHAAILSKGALLSGEYALLVLPGGQLRFTVYEDGGTPTSVDTAETMRNGTWHFFYAGFDPDRAQIFAAIDDGPITIAEMLFSIFESTDPVILGWDPVTEYFLTGNLDTVCRWNRLLTEPERKHFYRFNTGQRKPFKFSR